MRDVNIFQQLMEKSWLPDEGEEPAEQRAFSLAPPHVGLRVFLAVATVLFSLFLVVYVERLTFPDWRPLSEPWVLWLNTLLLVISSAGFHWAWVNADRGNLEGIKTGLRAGGMASFAFLAGQLWAWQLLVDLGFYDMANPAIGFFSLLTGLHGLHLLGGLVAWSRTTARVSQHGCEAAQVRLSVELCAVYWHFLLIVWLVLFGLMLSPTTDKRMQK